MTKPEMSGNVRLAHFATLDMTTSSEWTRKMLAWQPTGPWLIEDLANMKY